MTKRLILTALLLAALSGCAKPPESQLHGAEEAVARAYAEKAPRYAPELYERALQSLAQGKALIEEGRYGEGEQALSLARWHAARSLVKAREEIEEALRRDLEQKALEKKVKVAPPAPREPAVVSAPKVLPKKIIEPITQYRVLEGDTLWNIAIKPEVYGDALLWPLLYRANRDQIKDPREVFKDQIFVIPRELGDAAMEAARQEALLSDIFPP